MKYSLAFTSLVSAGVLLLGCGSEDSDPPPVTGNGTDPANSSGGANTANPGANTGNPGGTDSANPGGADPANPVVTPPGNEGQAGTTFNAGVGGASPSTETGGADNAGGMSTAGAAGAPVVPPELTLDELVGP